jgi:hypothetical protein
MPADFGAKIFGGITAPSGFIQESSIEYSGELATIRESDGHTVKAFYKPTTTVKSTVKTKGETVLTSTEMGSMGGSFKITESKYDQSNQDFPTSEVTATKYI